MHNAEAAIEPAFYDHEDDAVQRDRAAADWGADEVFASVPRRRFRGDHHASAARRAPVRRVSGPAVDESDDASQRAAWLAEVEAELAAADAPTAQAAPVEVLPATTTDGVEFDASATWSGAPADPAGRRTVTITGRPEPAPVPSRPAAGDRRRPPRTVEDRLGSRPDRLAGWSFGMGLLLIVVAAFS